MQNIRFLSPAAKLILYMGITERSGRFPSFGNIAAMQSLSRYNLVTPEGSYSLSQGHIVVASTDLFAVRERAISMLKDTLEGALKIDLNDSVALTTKFNELLQEETGRW